MNGQPVPGACVLTGIVVETFESGGRKILRLSVQAGSVDVPARTEEGAHLGDTIRIEGTFVVAEASYP